MFKHWLRRAITACQLWCWFQQWRYDYRTLLKCVGKVLIYHPPKFQCSTMIWHCYSLSWMLWGACIYSIENLGGVACLILLNLKLAWYQNAVRNVYELIAEHDQTLQASLLWFENFIPSWHAYCIASARNSMGLDVRPIRETWCGCHTQYQKFIGYWSPLYSIYIRFFLYGMQYLQYWYY